MVAPKLKLIQIQKESKSNYPRRARPALALPMMLVVVFVMSSECAFSQTQSLIRPIYLADTSPQALTAQNLDSVAKDIPDGSGASDDPGGPQQSPTPGLVRSSVTRILRDQEALYRAPFRRSSLKWDAIVLAGTGALIATDRHIERHLPGGNVDLYTNISNVTLGGTAAALAVAWGYGTKAHNDHLKELGLLEAEAVVNTFLIYTPMQFVAGRQRPGEGNGYGDFWRHHSVDTSFPAGHPMFTMAMASVVAQEYPKPWVEALAYGGAAAVMGGRLLGRDHWSSDVFVGSALGYFIGARIFHSHCNPKLGGACHTH